VLIVEGRTVTPSVFIFINSLLGSNPNDASGHPQDDARALNDLQPILHTASFSLENSKSDFGFSTLRGA